jgi:hypothetical protein
MKTFKLLMNYDTIINEQTILKSKSGVRKIKTELDLCVLMRMLWRKETDSKSFQEWADDLNSNGDYTGGFTKYDAVSNMSSLFHLEIDGKAVHIYDFFLKHLPFAQLQDATI